MVLADCLFDCQCHARGSLIAFEMLWLGSTLIHTVVTMADNWFRAIFHDSFMSFQGALIELNELFRRGFWFCFTLHLFAIMSGEYLNVMLHLLHLLH